MYFLKQVTFSYITVLSCYCLLDKYTHSFGVRLYLVTMFPLLFIIFLHCTTGDWHIESNNGWGWDQFLSLDKLRKVYLDKEDALNIEIEFQVVSATKYFPII